MSAIVEILTPQRVTFTRLNMKFLPKSGLWFVLDGVKCGKIKELFGVDLSSQVNEKYSQTIVIESSATGQKYALYMSYGEWRVGALRTTETDELALKKLFGLTT